MGPLRTAFVCWAATLLTSCACQPLAKVPTAIVQNETNAEHFHPWGQSRLIDEALDFHETNPLLTSYGRLEEGDLLRLPGQDRKAVTSSEIWQNRLYRYAIGHGASKTAAEAGIQFWRDHTCIEFEKVSRWSREPHVKFVSEQGCWSYVGYVANQMAFGAQPLSIGRGCTSLGTVTHEIGHSLGFYHEQARSDRDNFVTIRWDNILEESKHSFMKVDTTEHHGVPYDLSSVMHYGTYFFSSNGQPTIETKDPAQQGLIGQRARPSFRDVALMNLLYRCEELCDSPPACGNGGYVSSDCVCHCPPGTAGSACETVTGEYYQSQVGDRKCMDCPQNGLLADCPHC